MKTEAAHSYGPKQPEHISDFMHGQADSKQSGPPSYAENPPDITAAFANLNLNTATDKPTVDECIAHLKLLEAFSQLREDVGTKNGLYGIRDEFVASMARDRQTEVLAKMREKRWAIYVTKAVSRFEQYWKTCVEPDARMLRRTDIDAVDYERLVEPSSRQFTSQYTDGAPIPPLGM
jgi:hypothetical protein